MEIEGKILFDLGIQSGTSKAGNPWKKREMVLETLGSYPRKVKFTIFGDQRVDNMHLELGKNYVISVDIESREFNGRWYTDVNAFAARESGAQQGASYPQYGAEQQPAYGAPAAPAPGYGAPAAPAFGAAPAAPTFVAPPAGNDEDLPF